MNTRLKHDELWKVSFLLMNRLKHTSKFIEDNGGLIGEVADCGEDNPAKAILSNKFQKEIITENWDFNYPKLSGRKYDTILALEVLEHTMNPLTFLESIISMMNDDAVIYLSIPRVWPQYMKSIHHFHEIPTDRLMWLFKAAHLKIISQGTVPIRREWYYHIGIRPFIRSLWKSRIYKLKKNN